MSHEGDRWSRVSEVFLAVLEEEPERRAARLTELTGGDRALEGEVEALLSAHFEHGRFDRLSDDVGASVAPSDTAVGARVGPYELIEEIGRGGMGAVFRARRADGQFDQEVALKLHRSDVYRRELRERFLAERQILARIAHPNIARLLDGGVTEDGQSYFAMEYVDGRPIDEYCDERRLTVRDRLRLFRSVCDAVEHAHRNLVVHRDLKPSNVLVTADGTVKLLDFGIAKLLVAGGGSAATDVTQFGSRMLTPDYAAPEQIRGDPVTTSTDVYQLGVLLYELLSGVRPYVLRDASLIELERIVLGSEPEAASRAVTRRGDDVASSAERVAARSSTVDRLSSELRGDLDAIVSAALRPQTEERCSSASDLSADVGRYLTGHPVEARTPSLRYRMARFFGRHRVGVAAAAALLAAGTLFAFDRARQVRATEAALAQSEQVSDFLVSLFQSSSPEITLGDSITLRDVLDAGAERVRTELGEDPEAQARLMSVMAEVYEDIGVFEPAIELRRDALAVREASLPEDHPDIVWAAVRLGTITASRGDAEEARVRLTDAERRLESGRTTETERALHLNDLAFGWQVLGEHARAEEIYQASIAAHGRVEDPVPARTSPLINLGHLRLAAADPDSAEALFRQALAIRRSLFDDRTVDVANALLSVARAVQARGDLSQADSLLGEVGRIRQSIYPEGHQYHHTLAIQRAALLAQRGHVEEAESMYRGAVAGLAAVLAPDDGELALARNDWGQLLTRMGRFSEAEAPLSAAVPVFEARYGPQHYFTAIVRSNLADALAGDGRVEEADALLARVLADYEATNAPGDRVAVALGKRAQVRIRSEDLEAAAAMLGEAAELWIDTRGEGDPETQRTRNRLGAVLVELGRFVEAEEVLLAAYAAAPEETRSFTAQGLVALYEAWGRPDDAERYRLRP